MKKFKKTVHMCQAVKRAGRLPFIPLDQPRFFDGRWMVAESSEWCVANELRCRVAGGLKMTGNRLLW